MDMTSLTQHYMQHDAMGVQNELVHYQQVTTSTFTIDVNDLAEGVNIFGVLVTGDCEITLPASVPSTYLITIVDEGTTGTITVVEP